MHVHLAPSALLRAAIVVRQGNMPQPALVRARTAVQGTCVGQGRRRRQRPSVLQGNGVVPVPVHAAHAVAGTTAQWQGRRQRRRLHMCVHQDMRVQLAQWWVRLCDVGLGTSARRARATRWPTCAMPVARSARRGAFKAMACHRRLRCSVRVRLAQCCW